MSGWCGEPVSSPSQLWGRLHLGQCCVWLEEAKIYDAHSTPWILILRSQELIHLVCLTSGPEWLHVCQTCLQVKLHSCAFCSSCLYFPGTSTFCQFTHFPLLVELKPFWHSLCGAWGKADLKWPLPWQCLHQGAASPTQPSLCWSGRRLRAVCSTGCLQLHLDSKLYRS